MALIKLHQIDFNQTGSYTGSLYGTASYALTASYAANVPATASFALSSSYAVSSSNSLTSSYTEGLGGSNFTQNFSNSTTWTVNHNLGNKYVIIQVYDLNYDEILPQNIDLFDNNTAVITFPTPESGTVVVTLGGALQYVYNIDTSSLTPLSVFNQFTGSYNTGSFTGSFTGDGSGLYNIPSSGITGLNLSQIASGSVTASISPSNGFVVNTNTNIQGALTASSAVITGNVIVQGTASINTLIVNQTQLSTGSNQLGDAVNDFQTLYGTVRIPTGSLTVTGSTTTADLTIYKPAQTSYRERLLTANISDAPSDLFFINNATSADNVFVPIFGGIVNTIDTSWSLGFTGFTTGVNDTTASSYGIVNYAAFKTDNATDPYNGTLSNVTNRKLFTWAGINASSIYMTMFASGNLALNTSTNSGFKLDVNGTGRFSSNVQITGSLTIQPTSSATQLVSIIQAGSGSIALIPSGSGAIMASIPDGTAIGGNARGANAVDFQTVRSVNTSVASGTYSGVLSGRSNSAENTYSVTAGGFSNVNSTLGGTIAGGRSNTVNAAADATIGGGNSNTVSSNYSVVSGGQSNVASTNTHATVVGGSSNTASGAKSIAGGNGNTASGEASVSFGSGNVASGRFSTTLGMSSRAYLYNQLTVGAVGSSFGFTVGSSQYSFLVASGQKALATAATASITLDGDEGNLIIPNGNNRAWHTVVDTIATVTTISGSATGVTVGDSFMQTDKLLFKRIGGTSSIVGKSTVETIYDTSMSTAAMLYTAGSSQELAITFQAPVFSGGGSITCRVVSKVSLVEVAY